MYIFRMFGKKKGPNRPLKEFESDINIYTYFV